MSDLLKRLIEEFTHDNKETWQDKEVGRFVVYAIKTIFGEVRWTEGRNGQMALGAIIWMPDEERDAAWARFQLEKES